MIIPYTIVTQLGQVIGYGTVQEELFTSLSLPAGATLIPSTASYREYGYYDFDVGAFVPIPTKPSDHHIFDYAEKQWVDPRSLDQITAELESAIVKATQSRLDDFAHTRLYDGILSAATYATSTVTKFAAEGQYCVTARDSTWAALYAILAEVQAGTRPMPAGYTDIEPLLPALTWPN